MDHIEKIIKKDKILNNLIIRKETKDDYRNVEIMIRDAFWNLYVPGADEHYIAHKLRKHEDFIPELDLIAEYEGEIVGSVMYTKAVLTDEEGTQKEILSFGPLAVHHEYQRIQIGKALLEKSFDIAKGLGYDTIVIFGHPCNYISRGFKSCKRYNVCLEDRTYPTALLVRELIPGILDGRKWFYKESPAYEFTNEEAEEYDKFFEPREKLYQQSQEEFYIYSSSMFR